MEVIAFGARLWTMYSQRTHSGLDSTTSLLQRGALIQQYPAYAPIVDAKPADIASVYTTMLKCKDMVLGLDSHMPFKV